jgi:hypothetical protein
MTMSNKQMILIGAACSGLAFGVENSFAQEAPKPVVPAGRVELFNGKDFSGWKFHMTGNSEPSKTWSVTNGVIHCTGQPYGYAYTAQAYRDYKLTVEWRLVKVAPRADNTGIFIHTQHSDKSDGWIWPRCIECQGQNRNQGDLILMTGAAFKGYEPPATYKIVKSTETRNEKPVGEWNTYEIVCSGDTIKASVNGKLMNQATECNLSSGSIAIKGVPVSPGYSGWFVASG